LDIIDSKKNIVFKYAYSFRCNEIIYGDKNQIDFVKINHQKKEEVNLPDGSSGNIYIGFQNEQYLFVFENNAPKKMTFNVIFKINGNL
jgi:hypothetical protein